MHAHHPLRHRLFLILELQSHKDKKVAQLFSWVLTLMVLGNVAAVILASVPAIDAQYPLALARFEALSIVFFSAEYCCASGPPQKNPDTPDKPSPVVAWLTC